MIEPKTVSIQVAMQLESEGYPQDRTYWYLVFKLEWGRWQVKSCEDLMTMDIDNEPRYVISVAARMTGVQTYTLRYYEKIGILTPSRSGGNIRLYSERDIAQLRRVKTLMDDLGVNPVGAFI